jgi:general secretion pathway protein L
MTAMQTITDGFWRWLDQVAEAIVAVIARIAARRAVHLVEGEGGQFVVQATDARTSELAAKSGPLRLEDGKIVSRQTAETEAMLRGGRVELVFKAERFLFKPLELPSRAAEFLDGVVRAQIDRLTPWSPADAVFGCSKPADAGAGRIVVTVAATAKATIAPYQQAFARLGVHSVTISTQAPDAEPDAPAIKIAEENVAGIREIHKTRRILAGVLAGGVMVAAASAIAGTIVGGNLQTRQDELARSIAARRADLVAARNTPGDPATIAQRTLARRKNETPSSVIALEALSQTLPDNTYVTELRIEDNKLRVTGVSQDAPSLIRLIEQSRHFTRATFFAPTTRAPTDPGDRFNIEARIEPVFQLRQ